MHNDQEPVTTREFEHRLKALDEKYAAALKARDEALALQAKEYERRLETLNNAHERAERIRDTYLTKESYETAHRELAARIDTAIATLAKETATAREVLSNRIYATELWQSEQRGRFAVLGAVLGVGVTALSVLLSFALRAVVG